jgi:drug/metabolite transporter (DMT)-like permease
MTGTTGTATPRHWVILAFFAIYVVWGTTYLANLYVLSALKPFVISGVRYVIAGLLLAGIAGFRGQSFPGYADIKTLMISGILMLVGGSGLVVVAEQYMSSGYAAVTVATEPFWFIILDRSRWKLYRSKPGVIAGLCIGFAGILLFACFTPAEGPADHTTAQQLKGLLIVLSGCILWVIGTLYASRKIPDGSFNLWHTAVQLLAAGLFSLVISVIGGEWSHVDIAHLPLKAWGGLVYLIVFGSLIAYLAFAWLIQVQPPAIVSTHTYVNPIVAILMGWLFAGEGINLWQFASLVAVLTGVVITQRYKPDTV